MRCSFVVGAFAVATLVGSSVLADEALKSGLEKGKRVSAFNVLNCNGPAAGEKNCQV